jgi:hypothetical protein
MYEDRATLSLLSRFAYVLGLVPFGQKFAFRSQKVQPTRFRIVSTPALGGAGFCGDELWGCRLLVALPLMQDLLFWAKDLFFCAMMELCAGVSRRKRSPRWGLRAAAGGLSPDPRRTTRWRVPSFGSTPRGGARNG